LKKCKKDEICYTNIRIILMNEMEVESALFQQKYNVDYRAETKPNPVP
jgi:hypothetical protein